MFEHEAREFNSYPSNSTSITVSLSLHTQDYTNIICITHIYRPTLRNPKPLEHRYSRYNFVSSFYGVVDLVSIAPFYLMILLKCVDVHFDSAIFRVFRVFRMLELERFVPAFTLLTDVYRKSKDVLKATGILALIIWVGGATLFYVFQPELFGSVPNAMYYTAVFLGGEWECHSEIIVYHSRCV